LDTTKFGQRATEEFDISAQPKGGAPTVQIKARATKVANEGLNLRAIRLSLLIVLHNGFYAFAFEILVVTTCMSSRCLNVHCVL
jgi:hypothetical protein